MQAHRNGTPMLVSSGSVASVDLNRCTGCGECNVYCQFGALHLQGGFNSVVLNECMGCGVCVNRCIHGALSLVRELSRGVPLDIHALMTDAAASAKP
jgi:Pyruvate/2-oxoacid:ferredoxin oxidoreductase delta subunit